MGFTRTHVLGVFITESLLVTIGVALVAAGFYLHNWLTIPLLLAACFSALVAITVLLSSILSLMFFHGYDDTEFNLEERDELP